MMEEIRIAELFAGVGGFRLGLEKSSKKYKTVWSNQWEPKTKRQEASEIYIKVFGDKNHSNEDIAKVSTKDIPEHDLLVGGFPCQDYSVAKSLSSATGIQGKKGVLWWEIHRILKESNKKPEFLFLENVDRLLKSPASQRGKDYAIMLASLSDLGYAVEWRVINAAEYGFPQRRRRVFFLGYLKDSKIYNKLVDKFSEKWINNSGILANAFPIEKGEKLNNFELEGSLVELTNSFNKKGKLSPFENSGVMLNREVITKKVYPKYSGNHTVLKDVIINDSEVSEEFFINEESLDKWNYFKGAKKEKRVNKKSGFEYSYNEGAMIFPDALDKPSRTIVTGEGGTSPSRFKHVIKTESGRLRRLMPIELERLNMFPDNHTEGVSDTKRAFIMGNALVVGVIEKIGKELVNQLETY